MLDQRGVHGASPYVSRVLRDEEFKVWVNEGGEIDELYHMTADPQEKNNLLASGKELPSDASSALKKFQAVVDSLPKQDARPRYQPRAANPWDQKVKPINSKR